LLPFKGINLSLKRSNYLRNILRRKRGFSIELPNNTSRRNDGKNYNASQSASNEMPRFQGPFSALQPILVPFTAMMVGGRNKEKDRPAH
jgi:hypothetical protein